LNRRELFRRTVRGAAGVAASQAASPAREFPANHDASKDLARVDWKPAFLDDHQNATLIAIGELIIPETDTAGAKTALVHRFIDQLLAAETREVQQEFLEGLAYVDAEAFDRYRAAFRYLTPEQQTEVMSFLAYPHTLVTWQDNSQSSYRGYENFRNLKSWISRAYYSSEAGMKTLGYDGPPHGEFTGCDHAGGHG